MVERQNRVYQDINFQTFLSQCHGKVLFKKEGIPQIIQRSNHPLHYRGAFVRESYIRPVRISYNECVHWPND